MAKTISVDNLSAALQQELTTYHESVIQELDVASEQAVKDLVTKTKATAPKGATGRFRKNIASKLLKKTNRGSTYVWYVKAPDYRLTHLLVHGHATRNGGRTKADPFLENAMNVVLPEYENKVKEAISNGK